MTEKYEDVLEDVDRVFSSMADTTYQERVHEYLRRRKVDRSYEDTAVQRVVTDLVERAAACSGDSGMRDRLVAEATRLLDLARDMGAGEGDGE